MYNIIKLTDQLLYIATSFNFNHIGVYIIQGTFLCNSMYT